ncbi:P-loop ATPase, Sll1717 family [Nitrospirillum bahiense]|uniref:Cold-shock-like DNA binding protein n=1 Tax=Nitrospirillum amazonense TaxID=28077 RepID=A0A560GA75_9PROT|nr:cold shock domain-containing protein [Nitrospirillum amazonense]TWB30803.1 cold-shock-like DNA binding protein [Nitrospirillum amazonense]
MKKISEIIFGFSDAENYRRRENKDLFNKIFLRTEALEEINKRNIFFLVGEKGTGKTAYAVYYSNYQYGNNKSIHKFIRETDYHKFVTLRKERSLSLSDYTDIWKVIIYLLLSESIINSAGFAETIINYPKFSALKDAIGEYYDHAFSPEIAVALQMVENSRLAAELVAKHLALSVKGQAHKETKTTTNDNRFQTHLLTIERAFESALSSLNLSESHLLFIDGVDIRPSSVPYTEYVDCVKGLANAVWSINNDFAPSIRDSKGRLRVVLLLRPDIFNSLGMQNRNTKLRDNSVVLDWRTVYFSHRQSDLFKMADRMFSAQQDIDLPLGSAWDHYFPFNATNVRADENYPTSFVLFMRNSFHRPRDILTMLDTLADLHQRGGRSGVFEYGDLFSADFRRAYGDYLLGEIKDSLSFYYDEVEFEIFLKFFEFLDGAQKFSHEKYTNAFSEFLEYIMAEGKPTPGFMKSADEFLQFLYDQNILCYIEEAEQGERFIRWCFKERSPSNISPKVKMHQDYEIHYGLANVLNTGQELKKKRKNVRINLDQNARKGNQNQEIEKYNISADSVRIPPKLRSRGIVENADDLSANAHKLGSSVDEANGVLGSGFVMLINVGKKYGFIKDDSGGPDIHFRLSVVKRGSKIRVGNAVVFTLTENGGRKTANFVEKKENDPAWQVVSGN